MSQFIGPGPAHQGTQVTRYKDIKDTYFKKPKLSLSEFFHFLDSYSKPSIS